MLLRDLEDCDGCPLLIEELCNGGMSVSGSGTPIEPPCCSMDDDTDLDEWIKDYYERKRRWEKQESERLRKKKEKDYKNDVAKRKRQFLKSYCYKEQKQVKDLEKSIKSFSKYIDKIDSYVTAVNITNEMFGYSDRLEVNNAYNLKLKSLEDSLLKAKENLKKKQQECRETSEYKNIK